MAPKPSRQQSTTADILAAQRRSAHYGLDPTVTELPYLGDPGPAADALRQLSSPVLDELLAQVDGSSLALVMADREGRLTRRDAAASATLGEMDAKSLFVGFSLAETAVGTNGVGTSLETRRPTVVVGADHFLECFQGFTCVNAPIIQPITRRVEGTVGVVCPAEDTSPLLFPTVMRLAAQIGELLLEQATPEERFLLQQFLSRRRSPRNAVATIGQGVLIATPAAQHLLAGVDHAELWEHVQSVLREGVQRESEFESPANPPFRLRCHPLHRAGELEGAALELVVAPQAPMGPGNGTVGRRGRAAERLGDLVGVSSLWRHVVREALQAAQVDEPVVIVGERGSGRLSVATAIARSGPTSSVEVLDCSELLIDGERHWLLRARAALVPGTTLILRRIDHLPDDVAAALASIVAAPNGARLMATTETTTPTGSGPALLLDRLNVLQVDVPPLRDRREDIPPLARHLAALDGRHDLGQQVINALARPPWPGNVTELRQALRSAYARARTERLGVRHLPRRVRQGHDRKPLHGLRQREADAIVDAIGSTATRTEAAKLLGISRATLFRRLKAYGIDPNQHC